MAKEFFKRILAPSVTTVQSHPRLQFFGKLLHDPNLWHFNRHSLSGGMAVGLFVAFVPVPFQMILAAALAIYFHVNLPLSVSLVWITNPITMPPIFYFCYKVGAILLRIPPHHVSFKLSPESFFQLLLTVWEPFLLGSLVMGTLSAMIGYLTVQWLWRLQISRLWRNRQMRRLLAKQKHKLES